MSRAALPRIGLLALIWGSAFLWIKLADRGFSAVEVTVARLALGAAVLFAIVLVRRAEIPRHARLWAMSWWRQCSPTRSRTCCSH